MLEILEYIDQTKEDGEVVRKELAELGVDMLLKMVFTAKYWHGDLHPGNILVTGGNRLCVLDWTLGGQGEPLQGCGAQGKLQGHGPRHAYGPELH